MSGRVSSLLRKRAEPMLLLHRSGGAQNRALAVFAAPLVTGITRWRNEGRAWHVRGVCIFVYVGADHPLAVPAESAVRLTKLKRREHMRLFNGEHAYRALGCACALTLDGADEEDKAGRLALLDAFEVFLTAATAEGPVHALVTDGSRTPPRQVAVSVAEFRDFDFDSAWDAPSLLTVRT